jgi:hypothetical protein
LKVGRHFAHLCPHGITEYSTERRYQLFVVSLKSVIKKKHAFFGAYVLYGKEKKE